MTTAWLSEAKLLLRLALPLAIAQLFHTAMGTLDAYFLSHLTPAKIGGAGLIIQSFNFISAFMGTILSFVGIRIAYLDGKKETSQSRDILSNGIYLSLFLAVISSVLLLLIPDLLQLLKQPLDSIEYARLYVKPLFFCPFVHHLWITARSIFSSKVQIIALMGVTLVGVTAKYVSYISWGFKHGIEGIAYGNTIAYGLMAMLSFIFLFPFRFHKPSWQQMKYFLRIGLPAASFSLCDALFFTLIFFIVGREGSEPLSTHFIALQFLYLPYIIPYSLSVATAMRIAYYRGEGQTRLFSLLAKLGIGLALIPMIVISTIYCCFQKAYPLLWLVAIFQIFNTLQTLWAGVLRGLEKTDVLFLTSLITYGLIGIPSCLLLSTYLGLTGVWSGMIIAQATLAILLRRKLTGYLYSLIQKIEE